MRTPDSATTPLTPLESQVLNLRKQRRTMREIALQLGVSEKDAQRAYLRAARKVSYETKAGE